MWVFLKLIFPLGSFWLCHQRQCPSEPIYFWKEMTIEKPFICQEVSMLVQQCNSPFKSAPRCGGILAICIWKYFKSIKGCIGRAWGEYWLILLSIPTWWRLLYPCINFGYKVLTNISTGINLPVRRFDRLRDANSRLYKNAPWHNYILKRDDITGNGTRHLINYVLSGARRQGIVYLRSNLSRQEEQICL